MQNKRPLFKVTTRYIIYPFHSLECVSVLSAPSILLYCFSNTIYFDKSYIFNILNIWNVYNQSVSIQVWLMLVIYLHIQAIHTKILRAKNKFLIKQTRLEKNVISSQMKCIPDIKKLWIKSSVRTLRTPMEVINRTHITFRNQIVLQRSTYISEEYRGI